MFHGEASQLLELLESDFGQSGRDVRVEAIRCELESAFQRGQMSASDPMCKRTAFVQGETKRCEREADHDGDHVVSCRETTAFRWRT